MPGQAAKRKRHDLDGADQVSLPSLLFPAPLFLPSIFSIALTCNGHANYTLRQSPKFILNLQLLSPNTIIGRSEMANNINFDFKVFIFLLSYQKPGATTDSVHDK